MVHRIAIWRYFYFIRAFVFQKLKPTTNLKLQLKSWCHLICCWTESHLDPLYLNCIARKSLVFKVTSSKFEWSHTCGEYCHHLIQGNPEKYNRKQQMYLRINKNACKLLRRHFQLLWKCWNIDLQTDWSSQTFKKIFWDKLLSCGPYANILTSPHVGAHDRCASCWRYPVWGLLSFCGWCGEVTWSDLFIMLWITNKLFN